MHKITALALFALIASSSTALARVPHGEAPLTPGIPGVHGELPQETGDDRIDTSYAKVEGSLTTTEPGRVSMDEEETYEAIHTISATAEPYTPPLEYESPGFSATYTPHQPESPEFKGRKLPHASFPCLVTDCK